MMKNKVPRSEFGEGKPEQPRKLQGKPQKIPSQAAADGGPQRQIRITVREGLCGTGGVVVKRRRMSCMREFQDT
jgi:hypothetical protein